MPKHLLVHLNVGNNLPLADPLQKTHNNTFVRQQATVHFQGFKVIADWGDFLKLELTENQADVVKRRVTAGFRADVDHPNVKVSVSTAGAPFVRYYRDYDGYPINLQVVSAEQLDCPRILITDCDSLLEDQFVPLIAHDIYISAKAETEIRLGK